MGNVIDSKIAVNIRVFPNTLTGNKERNVNLICLKVIVGSWGKEMPELLNVTTSVFTQKKEEKVAFVTNQISNNSRGKGS